VVVVLLQQRPGDHTAVSKINSGNAIHKNNEQEDGTTRIHKTDLERIRTKTENKNSELLHTKEEP